MGKRKQKSTSFPHRFLIVWLLGPIRLEKGKMINFTVSLLLFSIKDARATGEDCRSVNCGGRHNIINYNEDEDLALLPSFLSSIFVYQLEAIRFLVVIGLN